MTTLTLLGLAAVLSVVLTLGLLWRGARRTGDSTATRRSAPRPTRDLWSVAAYRIATADQREMDRQLLGGPRPLRWHESGEVVE